ncbi:hypothetical protein K1720_07560 [Thermococcus argininiproducens]|uniref:DUF6884 domain-containing protein n=1 Tax=Thermococcus argininiproducens TaxID=2866384 RepID=A0A9E7SCG6_9EURY|nr:DUF6884 domain-containing protein [Thermococcus argininiproducens]USG99381.1 hypothetical protein K1720_07560 [Thermococcus argininiproducens]
MEVNTMNPQKIVVITACGSKKENIPSPAWKLYKSSRIRYLYKKSKQLTYPFYILSAKYGLVHSEKILKPYDELLTEEKANQLMSQVIEVLNGFDIVIYYKGGARKTYLNLIEKASRALNKTLITFGYANMGDINNIDDIIMTIRSSNGDYHEKKKDWQ